MTVSTDEPRRAWYREPMVWLLIAIPLSSVLAGVTMLVLASVTYDGLVADDYYKRGLEINRSLERDREAARLDIEAMIQLDARGTRVVIEAGAPGYVLPASLELTLSNATRAGLDRHYRLQALTPGEYVGPGITLAEGHWYIELASDAWRLTGRVSSATRERRLRAHAR